MATDKVQDDVRKVLRIHSSIEWQVVVSYWPRIHIRTGIQGPPGTFQGPLGISQGPPGTYQGPFGTFRNLQGPSGFLSFSKKTSRPEKQAFDHGWAISVNLAKIPLTLSSLNGHSSAPGGANDLDPFLSVRQLQTVAHGCWNFRETPLRAWDMAIWKWITEIRHFASILRQNWRYPL